MGISGFVGAGAQQALEDMFKQQYLREQLAQRERDQIAEQEQSANILDFQRDQLAQTAADRAADRDERAARERGDANRWGVEDMYKQAAASETQQERARLLAGLEQIRNNPNIPAEAKQALEAGLPVRIDDMRDPAKVRAERLKDLEAEAQIEAKYRQPQRGEKPDQPSKEIVSPDGKSRDYVTDAEAAPLIRQGWRFAEKGTGTGTGPGGAKGSPGLDQAMGEIANLSRQINEYNGPAQLANAGVRAVGSMLNLEDLTDEYNSALEGFAPVLAKAVGHVGQLTDRDALSAQRIFPTTKDPSGRAKKKLARAQRIMNRIQGMPFDPNMTLEDKINAASVNDPDIPEDEPETPGAPGGGGAQAGPDLAGLQPGKGRRFTSGPFAGQTWTVTPDGKPQRVP